jgi:hypothetical protein
LGPFLLLFVGRRRTQTEAQRTKLHSASTSKSRRCGAPSAQSSTPQVRKRGCLRHFVLGLIVSPRQARDTHRETQTRVAVSCSALLGFERHDCSLGGVSVRTTAFFEFSLCLSRACLGKMIMFIYKWLKNAVFRRVGFRKSEIKDGAEISGKKRLFE